MLDALRAATDNLLTALDRRAAPDTPVLPPGREEAFQRMEAALLAQDIDGARRALESITDTGNDAELEYRRAHIDYAAGHYDAAVTRLESALAHLDPLNDMRLRGLVLSGLGAVDMRRNHFEDAAKRYAEAVQLLHKTRDVRALGTALSGLALAQVALHQYDASADTFAEARVTLASAGDVVAGVRVDANLVLLDIVKGHLAEARENLQHVIERADRLGMVHELLLYHSRMAELELDLLKPEMALASSDREWSQAGRSASPPQRRQIAYVRADALVANGRLSEAKGLLQAIDREADKQDEHEILQLSRLLRAHIALNEGDAASALDLCADTVPALPDGQNVREAARGWLIWARSLLALGRDAEARALRPRVDAWAKRSTEPVAATYVDLIDAELADDRVKAAAAYARALAEADKAGVPADIAAVAESYGDKLLAAGDTAHAARVIGRVARWVESDYHCALLQARFYQQIGDRTQWQDALGRVRSLAGERVIPADLGVAPP